MQFLAMLMPLLGFVSFAAYVWLVVVAFKRSAGWGVLVLLFSPITAIIFAIKFWPEPKKPFLVFIGSFSAYFAIVMMFVVFIGGSMVKMAAEMNEGELTSERAGVLMEEHMDRMENSGLMSEADKAELQKVREGLRETTRQEEPQNDSATLTAALARLEADQPVDSNRDLPKTQPERASEKSPGSRDVVPVRELGKHVGEKLRVSMRDGTELVARLVDASGSQLEFERRLSSGTLTVYIDPAEIRSVRKTRAR